MKSNIIKYMQLSLLILAVGVFSSCLKSGLEDLPAFSDAEITDVKFDFRYKDMTDINPLDGEPIVKVVNLIVQNKVIDKEKSTITVTLNVPTATASFTEKIRNSVTAMNIVGKFNLSTMLPPQ